MADEAICIEAPKYLVRRTVSDSTAIAKGTLLKLADPNTASAGTGSGEAFGGIAVAEKVISDGITELSVAMSGVFDIKCNTTNGITCGVPVCLSGANMIRTAVAGDLLTGAVIGTAEETASASEVIRVRLGGFVS